MITVAAISPSLDVTYLVQRLRLGEIHRPSEVHRVAGGKPLNLARAAVTVGASVSTVAILGGATGTFIERALADAGIGVLVVSSPEETRTCVSIASDDVDGLTELYPYAPQVPAQVWQSFRTEVRTAVADHNGWLAVNGSAPQGLDPSDFADLIRIAHDAGLRVAVDTHGTALSAALPAGPELIKINRSEAADLLEQDPARADLGELAKIIGDRTGAAVIITDGARGAVGRSPGSPAVRVTPPADLVGRYPVGSGDAFLGGWLAATDLGADPTAALQLATGCGVANALVPGAGTLDVAIARQIAARVTTTPLT